MKKIILGLIVFTALFILFVPNCSWDNVWEERETVLTHRPYYVKMGKTNYQCPPTLYKVILEKLKQTTTKEREE